MQPADASVQDRTPTSILQTAEYKRATFARAAGLGRRKKTADSARIHCSAPPGLGAGGLRPNAGGFVRPSWAAGFSHKWHPSRKVGHEA